jgi:hypothetical protein
MQSPAPRDELVTGTEEQVVGIAKDDFGAAFDEVAVKRGFNRSLRADRHERRRVDDAVRRLELAETRGTVSPAEGETKRLAQADYY